MNVKRLVSRFSLLVPLSISVLATGCGGVKPLPVTGKVTLDGKPLAKGTISFHPDKSKGNTLNSPAVGNIENGEFSVAAGKDKGVPAGWYKVEIRSSVPINPKDEYSEHKSVISEKYADPATSGLTAEVKEGAASFDFTVTK
jgi:hypothetical protein